MNPIQTRSTSNDIFKIVYKMLRFHPFFLSLSLKKRIYFTIIIIDMHSQKIRSCWDFWDDLITMIVYRGTTATPATKATTIPRWQLFIESSKLLKKAFNSYWYQRKFGSLRHESLFYIFYEVFLRLPINRKPIINFHYTTIVGHLSLRCVVACFKPHRSFVGGN